MGAEGMGFRCTVHPKYFQCLHMQICQLTKTFSQTPNHYLCHLLSFADMHRVVQNLSCLMCIFPAEVKQGNVLLSCFSFQTETKNTFHSLFSAMFWWFHCLKRPPNSVPKCKKTVICLIEKICVLDNFIIMKLLCFLLTANLTLMDQQYVLIKVSLNQTLKPRLCINHLTKITWPVAHRNLTLYFPWEQWFTMH